MDVALLNDRSDPLNNTENSRSVLLLSDSDSSSGSGGDNSNNSNSNTDRHRHHPRHHSWSHSWKRYGAILFSFCVIGAIRTLGQVDESLRSLDENFNYFSALGLQAATAGSMIIDASKEEENDTTSKEEDNNGNDDNNYNISSAPKQLQQQDQATDMEENARKARTAALFEANQFPPHTAGAFVHIGKTGGSTLSALLRYGCHSFVLKSRCGRHFAQKKQGGDDDAKNASTTSTSMPPNPNDPPARDSHVSLLSTYYHVPDFENGRLTQYGPHYQFWVVSVRDPLERFLSAFAYSHPANGRARNQLPRKYHFLVPLWTDCFPNADAYVRGLGMVMLQEQQAQEQQQYTTTNITLEPRCRKLVTNIHAGPMDHIYFNLQKVIGELLQVPLADILLGRNNNTSSTTNTYNGTILVVRTEALWPDWTAANAWLGQDLDTIATYPHHSIRNFSATVYPVSGKLGSTTNGVETKPQVDNDSEENKTTTAENNNNSNDDDATMMMMVDTRRLLCETILWKEYQYYFGLLHRAVNIGSEEWHVSVQQAQANCGATRINRLLREMHLEARAVR